MSAGFAEHDEYSAAKKLSEPLIPRVCRKPSGGTNQAAVRLTQHLQRHTIPFIVSGRTNQ